MIGVLALRLLTVALFLPFSAVDKLLNFRGAVGQCQTVFAPPMLATLVIVGGFGIEVLASLPGPLFSPPTSVAFADAPR